MDSPPHRANILRRKANLFGVGTYISQGRMWVTVNFEQTTPAGGRSPRPFDSMATAMAPSARSVVGR
jgi:hypothetical protein